MTEMTSVGQDFSNAIETDHLTDEQVQQILEMFGDKQ